MNLDFTLYMPTRILFGCGKLAELGTTPFLPGKRALIVIGASGAMRKHGYLKRVVQLLRTNGAKSVVYDKIQPNPLVEHVEEGAKIAKQEKCDFVLGLGGGSTIDSAKSIAVMAKNPGRYWDYILSGSGKGKTPPKGALPIVAIPTTAGTGTEADPWTVITKTDTNEKIGWGNASTFPTLSIVDPELMLSVPPSQTAYTGMDAFFHSVESYLATCSQPTSDHLALEAVSLITKYLPIAVKDGGNIEARTKLAWANTEAGICESLSCCISHHSMEHALSAYFPNVPHGAGLTMLSVAYFGYLAERNPNRFPDLARAMGEKIDGLSKKEQAMTFITGLKKLIRKVGLKEHKLSEFGVRRSDLRKMAENSFHTMGKLFELTPIQLTVDDVTSIYERAFQ
ncbi:MAG: iron-containing alcohol dehydrogenase [Phycisphaerae bacterium]|nr:iron-containing alcohol dehydrogenase [Phycisphaerae bacterium]HON90741.1 iron-containing alcohol dehydrogenase [Sedimentisphaerales bacterium]